MEFGIGAVVRLHSEPDGPDMTVVSVAGLGVLCRWTDEKGRVQNETFNANRLALAPRPTPQEVQEREEKKLRSSEAGEPEPEEKSQQPGQHEHQPEQEPQQHTGG